LRGNVTPIGPVNNNIEVTDEVKLYPWSLFIVYESNRASRLLPFPDCNLSKIWDIDVVVFVEAWTMALR
jgi:hypothetical protein